MSAVRKVLVVDDDPVVSRSFDRVLSEKGYVVITASNGQEALNKLGAENVDVVFTDIRMPGMDGLEVAERVRAKRPWVPVVIVTGYGTTANETRAEAAGVSAFLHKPLSPEMIEESAEKAFLERALAQVDSVLSEVAAAPATEKESRLKNIALFLAAPFIGLAYLLAFPAVGMGLLAMVAARAAAKRELPRRIGRFAKNTALFILGPFAGLAYVLLFPFIGLAMLAWMGVRVLVVNRQDSE
jgi:CheY-like chemotaxis protein